MSRLSRESAKSPQPLPAERVRRSGRRAFKAAGRQAIEAAMIEYDLSSVDPLIAEKVRDILANQRFADPLIPVVQKNGEVIIYNHPPRRGRR